MQAKSFRVPEALENFDGLLKAMEKAEGQELYITGL